MSALLAVRDFSFSFGSASILKGINFQLPAGGSLNILGPNGSGKSTLLKCLLRLIEGGQGEIEIKGKPLNSYGRRDLAKIMAYVPQAGGWIPPFTIGEFLRLSRYPRLGVAARLGPRDREAAERAADLTGLTGLLDRPLAHLSGGERQKAYLAAALAQETEALLLDEPAAFLDPRHAAEMNALLKNLNEKEGLSLATVTHDLNLPLRTGGLALALAAGEQIFFGAGRELAENGALEAAYKHKFIRFPHPLTGQPALLAE